MKKLNVTVILILAFASVAFGQRGQAAPDVSRLGKDSRKATAEADAKALKESLVNLEKQSWVAWQKRDGKFYQGFLSDEHVEMGAGGTANKTEVVAFVGSPACVVRSYAVEKFELTVLDADTALLTYHAAQDTTCNGTAVPSPAWVSSLYVRRGDRWLNAFYQQTPAHK